VLERNDRRRAVADPDDVVDGDEPAEDLVEVGHTAAHRPARTGTAGRHRHEAMLIRGWKSDSGGVDWCVTTSKESPMTAPTVSSTAPTPHAAGIPPELREHLAQQLGEQRANLLARVNRLGVDIEALHTMTATRGQGETEHSSSETERAVVEQLEAGTSEALEDIAYALARIDDGSY